MKRFPDEDRPEEQIREHYELEKLLASRLRNATQEERLLLYGDVYNELYSRLPHHPRHRRSQSPEQIAAHVESQLEILRPFLKEDMAVLEVGSGACHTLRAVASQVRRAIGVEVAVDAINLEGIPSNLELVQFDGINIPLPMESVDLVYSMAVMEHLHPDDAIDQLRSIYKVLKPGGLYVLYTPHRYRGPGDVSKYFDDVATGFHLKEWTCRQLKHAMTGSGFTKVHDIVRFKGRNRLIPVELVIPLELVIGILPAAQRRCITKHWAVSRLLDIRMAGWK